MNINDLKDCPWRRTRVSPTKEEIFQVIQYIEASNLPIDSFLEFGCGVSTWYLSQLNFGRYVSVEEYEDAIIKVTNACPSVKVVKKWEDIPKNKYRYVFVDSHAGGNAAANERYKTFEYAIVNDLLYDDTIMIAHDHSVANDTDEERKLITTGWYGFMNKYGWKLTHQILFRKNFGVYIRR
jgi:hypothetical protein